MTRISTGMLYQQSLSAMQSKQASLARTQNELTTGKKLLTAKDDPVGAGAAVTLDRSKAELERFGKNADAVGHRLNMQESALTQAGDLLGRIQVLAVQAGNGTLSDGDRQAIASEVQSLRDGLFDIANTADGTGRYLFGGTQDGGAPFIRHQGVVSYGGDQTQRRVEIAPEMFVSDALPGSELFLRVPTGSGGLDARAAAANSGSGKIGGFSLNDSNAWNGDTYRIEFDADGAYVAFDDDGARIADGVYVAGDAISIGGVAITLTGEPAAGDVFEIGPSRTADIFSTIDDLVHALTTPATTDAQKAAQQNALQASIRNISSAEGHFIDARAAGGAQLSALDSAADLRGAFDLNIQTTLSGMRDLDYVEAISRFSLEKVALDAAQLSFVQMQRNSLFDLLR
ncbi:flagellar hook-associated protein 3 [Lysobacteraceae bacterium NML93-0399]|nr:flagellar hook-associated protein 3 [Xanthomonadaceae bacterium NML93-0399]